MTLGGGTGGSAGGGGNNVGFVKPQEPKFLREIKEKVGYREADGIEAKMRRAKGGVDREDVEDEAPTVVVLNKGDLTEEEAKAVVEKESDEPPPDGKIKFKKPTRRKANRRKRACCLSMKTRKMRSTDSKLSCSV